MQRSGETELVVRKDQPNRNDLQAAACTPIGGKAENGFEMMRNCGEEWRWVILPSQPTENIPRSLHMQVHRAAVCMRKGIHTTNTTLHPSRSVPPEYPNMEQDDCKRGRGTFLSALRRTTEEGRERGMEFATRDFSFINRDYLILFTHNVFQ